MNAGVGVNRVELDLLCFPGVRVGRLFFCKFGAASADAVVRVIDIVQKDFLGLMARCGDTVYERQLSNDIERHMNGVPWEAVGV